VRSSITSGLFQPPADRRGSDGLRRGPPTVAPAGSHRLRNGWLQLLIGGVDGGNPASTANHPDVVEFTWAKRDQFEDLEGLLIETVQRNNADGDPTAAATEADAGTAGRTQRMTDKRAATAEAQQATLARHGILWSDCSC
jgi:hypothetical protein